MKLSGEPRTVEVHVILLQSAGSRLVLLNSDQNPTETDARGTEPEFPVTQTERSARVLSDREVVRTQVFCMCFAFKERVKLV